MNKRKKRGIHLGLSALKEKVKIRGLNVIDRRYTAGRALFEWRDELLTALGGEENVSPQKRVLVDAVVRTRMYIDHADNYLMSLPEVIIRRRKCFMPLVKERTALTETLARLLDRLGLDRQAKKVEDLDAFIERREKEMEEAQNEKPDNH
jgi:hypothetical protein